MLRISNTILKVFFVISISILLSLAGSIRLTPLSVPEIRSNPPSRVGQRYLFLSPSWAQDAVIPVVAVYNIVKFALATGIVSVVLVILKCCKNTSHLFFQKKQHKRETEIMNIKESQQKHETEMMNIKDNQQKHEIEMMNIEQKHETEMLNIKERQHKQEMKMKRLMKTILIG